jgi:hypothetical protein
MMASYPHHHSSTILCRTKTLRLMRYVTHLLIFGVHVLTDNFLDELLHPLINIDPALAALRLVLSCRDTELLSQLSWRSKWLPL